MQNTHYTQIPSYFHKLIRLLLVNYKINKTLYNDNA